MIYKGLKDFILNEAVLMPKELGQEDSDLQELIGSTIEKSRVSTFRNSKGDINRKYENPFK